MEAAALISESNWNSFAFEDSELFMSQLFCNNPYPNLHDFDSNVAIPGSFSWFSGDQDHASNSNSWCTSWPLDGSNTGHSQDSIMDIFPNMEEPNPSSVDHFLVLNEDQCMNAGGESRIDSSKDIVPRNGQAFSSQKRKFQTSVGDDHSIAEQPVVNYQSDINPKKKATISGHAQRKANKSQTLSTTSDEDNVACQNGQSSSSYSSEDDSNASDEHHGGGSSSTSKGSMALSLSCKTRASRGSATDPQSLYARKRREKINERLRILQNLVPNGTKVDISTMLEEAVQYVKFLQLQIKVLSSDDLWMYAPIAYNGMNAGFDLKISPKQ